MKHIIKFIFFCLFCFCCKAQTGSLNELKPVDYEVVIAFLNQKYDYNNSFYLNNFIQQENYSNKFKSDYIRELKFYKKADSICNFVKDTVQLKFYCPAAFNRKKYENLLSEKDFRHLENNYSNLNGKKLFINTKKISDASLPIILEHKEKRYKNHKRKQFPSLEIKGIYFTDNHLTALLQYKIIKQKSTSRLKYAVLKKENKVWWRLIGILSR